MSDWGSNAYGDPCRECGFRWAIPVDEALDLVGQLPVAYAGALAGATGKERHPDLGWSVGAYVCHVGDNLRIWAERLAGVAAGADRLVAAYDQDLLATAKQYEEVALAGALWSLGRAVTDWMAAVDRAGEAGVVLHHPERGDLALADVVRSNAHDAFHHGWDIRRSVAAPSR
jgi:hypothetical protein